MTYEEKLALLEQLTREVQGKPHVLGSWELQPTGLDRAEDPDEVEAETPAEMAPLDEDERKRLFPLVNVPKGSELGRKGMRAEFVERMYQDYRKGKSLAEVARKFYRTRQSVYETFRRRGFALRSELRPSNRRRVELSRDGFDYSPAKGGYLRATRGDRHFLHVRLWEAAHGPVPIGYQVFFRDGDIRNFDLSNLGCESVEDRLAKVRPPNFEMYLQLGRGSIRKELAA